MKSAVIATVFIYLISAQAAAVGAPLGPADVDAPALDAVLNGEVSISAKYPELVRSLLTALGKRDDAPTTTDTAAAGVDVSIIINALASALAALNLSDAAITKIDN